MELFLIFAVMAVSTVAILASINWRNKRKESAWNATAEALGLELWTGGFLGSPTLDGVLDGIDVTAKTLSERHHRTTISFTTVTAKINANPPFDMQIRRKYALPKAGVVFDGEDFESGDAAIDDVLVLRGNRPDAIRELATAPAVKTALLAAQKNCRSLLIDNQEVFLKLEDAKSNQDKLIRYIRLGITLAAAIGEASTPPHNTQQPAE